MQVTIVCGETGSGKSTQVPQFVLDADPDAQIICSQPRRLPAICLAERIANERGATVGEETGYTIRLEAKCGPKTRLLFVTCGVLLRKLVSDPLLMELTHVVMDEVRSEREEENGEEADVIRT